MLPEVKRAVSVVGSVSSLSRLIRTNRSYMYAWTQVPDDLVIPIETAQINVIKRKEKELRLAKRNFIDRRKIRPDLFPKTSKAKDKK